LLALSLSPPLSLSRHHTKHKAAERADGSLLANGRELDSKRVLVASFDGGDTWPGPAWEATGLRETFQGCEGSMVADEDGSHLYYTGVQVSALLCGLSEPRGGSRHEEQALPRVA
jgi:hypothetical protein